jgi:hypothetical protein
LATVKLSGGLRTAVRAELESRPDCPRDLPPEPGPEDIRCHRCGAGNPKLSWHQMVDGRRTIRADCRRCNHHIKFASLTSANIAAADANVSPTGLLDVLVKAQEAGVSVVRLGDQISLQPWEKVTPELKALARQHQHALMKMLVRSGPPPGAASAPAAEGQR